MYKILKSLIAAKTYYPVEGGAFLYLKKFLRKKGFITTRQEVEKRRYNLLAEKGNAKEAILILIHIDTVAPASNWERNPFALRKEGDNYIGLGAFDMKGGTAALLSLLDSFAYKNYTLKLAFCIGEEGISDGAYALSNSSFINNVVFGLCPEACLVPDKWPLPIMITIGGRGRCVVEIKIPGETRHGAENNGGINAIAEAAALVRELKKLPLSYDKRFGKSAFFVRSFHAENDSLSIPDVAMVEIDYQLVPGETPELVLKKVNLFVKSLYSKGKLNKKVMNKSVVVLKERKTPYVLPYAVSESNRYVKKVKEISQELFGKSALEYTKSVADENVLVNAGVPIITIGPLGGNAHEAQEWVSKTSLEKVAQFYKKLFAFLDAKKGFVSKR